MDSSNRPTISYYETLREEGSERKTLGAVGRKEIKGETKKNIRRERRSCKWKGELKCGETKKRGSKEYIGSKR